MESADSDPVHQALQAQGQGLAGAGAAHISECRSRGRSFSPRLNETSLCPQFNEILSKPQSEASAEIPVNPVTDTPPGFALDSPNWARRRLETGRVEVQIGSLL